MALEARLILVVFCSSWLAGTGMGFGIKPVARELMQTDATRHRRSDDVSPFAPVVSQLSQEVNQLKAEVAALQAGLAANQMTPVSFTARFSRADVTGLGTNQILVFDDVANNIGNGYNKDTGFFTAPVAGSYVFFLGMQRHGSDESTFIAGITKGSAVLGVAEAGYSPFEHGSMLVTVRLEQGDAVYVKVLAGTVVYGGMSTAFSGFRISP